MFAFFTLGVFRFLPGVLDSVQEIKWLATSGDSCVDGVLDLK